MSPATTLPTDSNRPESPPSAELEMPWGQRSMCASDQLTFENCPSSYWRRKMRHRRLPREFGQITGDLAHKAACIADPDERKAALDSALARVPEAMREEAAQLVQQLILSADAMQDDYVGEVSKDKDLFRYTDDDRSWDMRDLIATGWELVMKPDEIGMVWSEEHGQHILQIADLKKSEKMSEKMPYKCKHQLLFFALVAHLARVYGYEGPIRCVVKFLGSQEETPFEYKPSGIWGILRRTRLAIKRIEACVADNNNFPEVTGPHCKFCPYRVNCESYGPYASSQGWDQEEQPPRPGQLIQLPVLPPAANQ